MSESKKEPNPLPAMIVCFLIVGGCVGYVAVSSGDAKSDTRVLSGNILDGQVRVWRDPETGCEYLRHGDRRAMTPRLGPNGYPICNSIAP